MARAIGDLGGRNIPDPSGLVGVANYLQAYNVKYAELAGSMLKALEILKGKFQKTFPDETRLGGWRARFILDPNEKELVHYELPENVRWHPSELESIGNPAYSPNVAIPQSQLVRLVADFDEVERQHHYKESGSADNANPAVRVVHNIMMLKGTPEEGLLLEYQRDGTLFKLVDTHSPIDPAVYRLNPILATYGRTESAKAIRLGFNRLALIDAVVAYLATEIEENGKKLASESEAVTRFKSADRIVQPGLPGLLN